MSAFLDEIDTLLASPMGEVRTAPSYTPAKTFEEGCKKCGGSGVFRGYSGRSVGQCFACKGKGKFVFKTSPEARATAKNKKVANKVADIEAFKTANPAVYEWLTTNTTFEFAVSLYGALMQYGSLTDGQLAAAEKCVASLAKAKAAQADKVANAPAIDVSKIEVAFAAAKGNGIKRPKLNLGTFKFSPAPLNGKNAGAIYVKDGESYIGKVAGGKFVGSYACTEEQQATVIAMASDPKSAATAYGLRTGNCSCCGRLLTKGASIDLGIGPICAAKYGW